MVDPQSPEIEVRNGVTVIQLGPDYDNLSDHLLDTLQVVLLECGRNADPPKVVIDLSHTVFFGSAFLEILLKLWKELSEREGNAFALSGLNDNCAEVLQVTQLDSLWKIYKTHEEAEKALASV
ncbi:putative anti-sigma factor antagonist [Symmachiella macrocystis]|uniref:Putative anti-sigma factor antagonist n=1 Tax=Symmachiella macrocystis TaxID=2527985 RepID=A0A5C6BBY1_9PLAN|nr:STAS domain-containing protein [Symmachiella macrocystis]TWU09167.1 putative anti-sigma factor antagonist [Symmachiella macrocystis]